MDNFFLFLKVNVHLVDDLVRGVTVPDETFLPNLTPIASTIRIPTGFARNMIIVPGS